METGWSKSLKTKHFKAYCQVPGDRGPGPGPGLCVPLQVGGRDSLHLRQVDIRGSQPGQVLVLNKVCKNVDIFQREKGFLWRTDYQNNHVNGQGNIGFCCSSCEILPRIGNSSQADAAQRSKFVLEQDDRVKLPDTSAVVFGDPEDFEERRIPPS